MIFRQLSETVSSTCSYLPGCEETRKAILIDPVINAVDRDLQAMRALGPQLDLTLDAHLHADPFTAALEPARIVGSRIAAPAFDRLPCVDVPAGEGERLRLGSITIDGLHTPGHADGHFAYLAENRLFTGDALLADGCGRTAFQNGDAESPYRSVRTKPFSLPGESPVRPVHDCQGRFVSSIAQDRARNPRLGEGRTLDEFEKIMAELALPYPTFIDRAVHGNHRCGVRPSDLPERLRVYSERVARSAQG